VTPNIPTMNASPAPLSQTSSPDWGVYAPSNWVERLRTFSSARSERYAGKRLAFLARKMALAVVKGPVDVTVFGHKMRIEPFANLAEKRVLFTPQYFDPVERDLLRRVLPGDGVFVDIGANVGAYSFFAASCMSSVAKILAIEPQPDVYQRLCDNIAYNPGVPIEAIALAVADVDGPIQLFVDRGNAGETSMRRVRSDTHSASMIEVQARPLAAILAERNLPRVDALKIDIEGAEDLALVPFFCDAPETLWPRLMIIENSPESWQTDCIALAQSKGYQVIAETRLNVVLTR
jgi:FkbM family methyltransferase